MAVRIAGAIQSKVFLDSQRKRKLASVLADMAKMVDSDTNGVFLGDAPINLEGAEKVTDKVLRKFFVDISDGKVRVPGPVYRDMRCFVHNLLNIIVSQGIDTARRLGCSTLHADLFTDGLV